MGIEGNADQLLKLMDTVDPFFEGKHKKRKWVKNRFETHKSTMKTIEHLRQLVDEVAIFHLIFNPKVLAFF